MKTQNEQIASVMGWECENNTLLDGGETRHPDINIIDAKLLQQRIVAGGWEIQMTISWQGFFLTVFSTCVDKKDVYRGHDCQSEPAAIVSLFCKVYSIRENHA